MFRKRPLRPSKAPSSRRVEGEGAIALDTLAQLLREYGRYAFDIAEADANQVRHDCERLAAELLVGPSKAGTQGRRAKHGECRRYFGRHREREQRWVLDTVGQLREVVRSFADCLNESVREESAQDERLSASADQVANALAAGDIAALRQQAEELSARVRESIQARRARHDSQVMRLGHRVKLLRQELSEAREAASFDGLTKVFNRGAFDGELSRMAELGVLLGSEPCLLMIDVDHFKDVNDTYGHWTGDQVLKEVANTLVRSFLRKEDFVARYGGEEFAVVLPESELEAVAKRTDRVRATIAQLRFDHDKGAFGVTVSIGIASLRAGEAPADWVRRADEALYRAKQEGRNRTVVGRGASQVA